MQPLLTTKAVIGSCAAMVAVGGLLAVYGSAVVEFENRFGLDPAAAGTSIAIQGAGAVIGVLAAQPVLRRRGNRFTMRTALALIVVGCLVVAVSTSWPLTLSGAAVAGLGLGGCDALVTQLLVFGQGRRGPFLVNVAHGCFGLGTVLAPVAIAVVGAGGSPVVFVGIAVIAVAAAVAMAGVAPRPTPADPPQARQADQRTPRTGIVVVAFLVLYIVHFGVQSGVGIWGPTRLLELGYSTVAASLVISGYWSAMVIGRFAVAPIASRVPSWALVTVSCVGMTVATGLSFHEPMAPWAYVAAGACIGPIFPNGLTWLARTGHAQGSAFAYVIAAAMAGAAVFPPLLGLIVGGFGAGALAVALMAMSTLAVAACAVILAGTRRSEGARSRTPGSDDNPSNADRTIVASTGGRHAR